MRSEFLTPEYIITFISGAWIMGNALLLLVMLIKLRKEALAETNTPEEADKQLSQSLRKYALPQIALFVGVEFVLQVLMRIFGN